MKRYWKVTQSPGEGHGATVAASSSTSEKEEESKTGKVKRGEPRGRAVNREKYLSRKMPLLVQEGDLSQ